MAAGAVSFAQIIPGTYYLQNVESGLFLSGSNSWGTQASATVNGDPCFFDQVEGGYNIVGEDLTSGNKTLGYNLYVDANLSQNGNLWTVTPVAGEEGVYTIYGKGLKDKVEDAYEGYIAQSATAGDVIGYVLEGVKEITPAAKWRALTRTEAIANIKSGDNVTFLLQNPNFTRMHAKNKWIVDEGCTNYRLDGGENNNMCAESYHSIFNIHQSLTDMPNGKYIMTAQGFYRQEGEDNEHLPVFYANGQERTFSVIANDENSMSDASVSFTKGLYTIDPIEFEVTDGTITLGLKNEVNTNLWCIWDNFQIVCIEREAPYAPSVHLLSVNNDFDLGETAAVPEAAAIVVDFGKKSDVFAAAAYEIFNLVENGGELQVGKSIRAGMLSINSIGYAEFDPITFLQGQKYRLIVTCTDNKGATSLFEYDFDGATLKIEVVEAEFAGLTRELVDKKFGAITVNKTASVDVEYVTGANVEYAEGVKEDVYTGGAKVAADNVFFPSTADEDPERYFGVKITPQEGKELYISSIDLSLAAGNAFKYILSVENLAGDVIYETAAIKVNNYNNATKYYGNEVIVTADTVMGMTQTATDMIVSWGMVPTTTAFGATQPLGKNIALTAPVVVKVKFWDKNGKSLTFKHLKVNVLDAEAIEAAKFATLTYCVADQGGLGVKVKKGDVTLNVSAEEGWSVDSITVNDVNVTAALADGKLTFDMQDDAVVAVTYKWADEENLYSESDITTGLITTKAGVIAYVKDGQICVESNGAAITLYTISGAKIAAKTPTKGTAIFSVPAGAYIVKVGSEAIKLVIQ